MTTRDAAAARRQLHLVALAAVIGLAGISLAGCGGSLFDSAGNTSPEASPAPQAVAEQAPLAKVVVSSVVGPPDELGKQFRQEIASALGVQRVAVMEKNEGADYQLRPYVVAAREKTGTKLSYVMDVTDTKTNQRVSRFTGEEVVPTAAAKDTWAAVTPTVMQSIAAKATGSFVSWLPSASTPTSAAPPPSAPESVGGEKAETPVAARTPKATRSGTKLAGSPPATQTTGSITKDGSLVAMVAAVRGAPGDGSVSLTAAIQRELKSKGVVVAEAATPAAYKVEGAVTMGEAREGKQPIQIEWVVKDPAGKKLGTVSQKNDIPEGSLDGAWGRTADQAAGAAAQGILKLLPLPATALN